jgi:hypothetical protein
LAGQRNDKQAGTTGIRFGERGYFYEAMGMDMVWDCVVSSGCGAVARAGRLHGFSGEPDGGAGAGGFGGRSFFYAKKSHEGAAGNVWALEAGKSPMT